MKKMIKNFSKKALSLVLTMTMLLSMILSCITITATTATAAITADTSWYDSSKTEFTLTTAAQLLGFYSLGKNTSTGVYGSGTTTGYYSPSNTFAGKTIKLGADIDLNPGFNAKITVSGSTVSIPSTSGWNRWDHGIAVFAGTFDGQGHTISGLVNYKNATQTRTFGGFIDILSGTVKNVAIVNSIVVNNQNNGYSGARWGGIVGDTDKGTIENVYTDMQMVMQSNNSQKALVGGIIGSTNWVSDDVGGSVKNCVFAGDIYFTTAQNGTTLGHAQKNRGVGQISAMAYNATLTDNLAIGTMYTSGLTSTANFTAVTGADGKYASICPYQYSNSGATLSNNYAGSVAEASTPSGWTYNSRLGTALPLPSAYIDEWFPAASADEQWYVYHRDENEFTINTAGELLYFGTLVAGDADLFSGKTVKLGADIDLNPGWSAATKVVGTSVIFPSQPTNVWTSGIFKGMFDGQGHTIKGLYVYTNSGTSKNYHGGLFWEVDNGGTASTTVGIKNLSVKNSICRHSYQTGSDEFRYGGIAGYFQGYAENIYSEMEVWVTSQKCNKLYLGGVFGSDGYTVTSTMKNIVFNGVLGICTGTVSEGGIGTIGKGSTSGDTWHLGQIMCLAKYSDLQNCLALGTVYTNGEIPTVSNYSISRSSSSATPGYAPMGPIYAENVGSQTNCYASAVADAGKPSGWVYSAAIGSAVPSQTVADMIGGGSAPVTTSVSNFDGTQPAGSIFTIGTVAEFKDFITKAKANSTAGYIFRMTADIDLNPHWNAKVIINDGNVKFPTCDYNGNYTFTSIGTFKGTFDGQGHVLSGIYDKQNMGDSSLLGGLFDTLDGGTLENLVIKNSFFCADRGSTWGSTNQRFGGLVGDLKNGAVLRNLYVDAEIWFRTDVHKAFGGLAATATGAAIIENVVLAGRVAVCGSANDYMHVCSGSSQVGYLLANGNSKTIVIKDVAVLCERAMTNTSGSGGTDNINWLVHYSNGNVKLTNVSYGAAATALSSNWSNRADTTTVFGSYLPTAVLNMLPTSYLITEGNVADLTGTEYYGSSFFITSVADLQTVQALSSDHDFMGITFILTDNLDVSPNMNLKVDVSNADLESFTGSVTYPSAPAYIWGGLHTFAGTLDGQGHWISGLYRNGSVGNWGKFGGICDSLAGGTIKNISIVNSIVLAEPTSSDARIGGIAGYATQDNSTIENVYAEIDVWYKSYSGERLAGLIAQLDAGVDNTLVKDVIYKGTVGHSAPGTSVSLSWPSTTGGDAAASLLITDNNEKTTTKIQNVTAIGEIYVNEKNSIASEVSNYICAKRCGGSTYEKINPLNIVLGEFANIWDADGYVFGCDDLDPLDYDSYGEEALFWLNDDLGYMIPKDIDLDFASIPHYGPVEINILNYTGNESNGSTYRIYDAAGLIKAAELSREGQTFYGYKLELMSNIDLNPGWNATVTIANNTATLPKVPTIIFPGFLTFRGELNGNNYTISGIFVTRLMKENTDTDGGRLGFIQYLSGGTVKNLKINNSLVFADFKDLNQGNDCKIGGLVAKVNADGSVINNVAVNMNVWYRSYGGNRLAGIVADVSNSLKISNVRFDGTVGNMTPSNAVPSSSTGAAVSQIIADGAWKTGLRIYNITMNGTCYSNVDDTKIVAVNDKANYGTDMTAADVEPADVEPAPAYSNKLAAFNIWPSGTGLSADSKTASYEAGNESYVKYYMGATASMLTNYINTLQNNGYTLVKQYSIGSGSSFALLQKAGAYTVFASLIDNAKTISGITNRMRVYVEPYGNTYNTNDTVVEDNVCTAQLWQLNVDGWYQKANGGMTYIIRMTDGKFIVIDGGYHSEAEAANIYKVLVENNELDSDPVIAAWFITHLHDDHTGGFVRFAETYANEIKVEAFYFNFPTDEIVDDYDDNMTEGIPASDEIYTVIPAMKAFSGAKLYNKIHTGMKFGFAGVYAQVLYTHEDGNQSVFKTDVTPIKNYMVDGNDTSLIVKFVFTCANNQSFIITGDAYIGTSNALYYTYKASDLKCDFVQVAHHGYRALGEDIYEYMDPTVALWPVDILAYNQDETPKAIDANTGTFYYNYYHKGRSSSTDNKANKYLYDNCQEHIPAYENVCLDLPYVIGSTYPGGTSYWTEAKMTEVYNQLVANRVDGIIPSLWYDENAEVLEINSRSDFKQFSKNASKGVTYEGQTIVLNIDVILNKDWTGLGALNTSTAISVEAPASLWTPVRTFSGIFEGQGHTIQGLYAQASANSGSYGAFINNLDGGTVKDVAFENLLFDVTNKDNGAVANLNVGGLIGKTNGTAKIENVYLDGDLLLRSNHSFGAFSGVVANVETGTLTMDQILNMVQMATVSKTNSRPGQSLAGSTTVAYTGLVGRTTEGTASVTNSVMLGNMITNGTYSSVVSETVLNDANITTNAVFDSITARDINNWPANNDKMTYSRTLTGVGTLVPLNTVEMVQASKLYAQSRVANGSLDVRFVGVLDMIYTPDLRIFDKVGFEINIGYKGELYTTTIMSNLIFSSVKALGSTVTPGDLGFDSSCYLTAAVVEGCPVGTAQSPENITFTVRMFMQGLKSAGDIHTVIDPNAKYYCSSYQMIDYSNGVVVD